MKVLEGVFIYMEDYLQNRCRVLTSSCGGENEVFKKCMLFLKICLSLKCLLTSYNTKANFPILESVTL